MKKNGNTLRGTIYLILATIFFTCIGIQANAQFGLGTALFDVQYNNQFDDSTEFTNSGDQVFLVDTVAPYGSFVSQYMGAINSFTADNGFAMLDLDAQPNFSTYEQYAELNLNVPVTLTGHDNYGIAFQSYYGAYDSADSCFVKVTRNGVDTLIRLHADLPAGSIEDSTHYIDLTDFVESGDNIEISFVAYSSWGLAWMLDDLVVLAWNPTVVISSIYDCINCELNPNRKVVTIYNMLGQPVNTMVKGNAYIKVYNDGTREKVAIR
ncbi:hypothetical protein [uncultured Mediterranean phage uvDeep-CGR2-KM19-C269]|nr:hypothetical protein [uncultured Mediterranean phage uvDeep-CGR2-KM19-C269]